MSDAWNYSANTADAPDTDFDSAATPNPIQPSGGGQPGVPIAGAAGWRAGAFGAGGGLLGLIKVADKRPVQPSGALPSYETDSWRWNDPDAVAYDLDRAQRSLGESQGLANALEVFGGLQNLAGVGTKGLKAIGLLTDAPLGLAGFAYGAYLGHVETPRLQGQVQALQRRLDQLKGQSGT